MISMKHTDPVSPDTWQIQNAMYGHDPRPTPEGDGRWCLDADGEVRWVAGKLDIAEDVEAAEPPEKRTRKPSLAGVIRQMKRAGIEIAGCAIERDGSVRIISGKPGKVDDDRNEWDTVQ